MRFFIIFIGVFLYADISYVINTIKKIENYSPTFKPFADYNIFAAQFKEKKEIPRRVVFENRLFIYAIFEDKVNINGIWLKKGDAIEGYKVLKIDNNKVVLEKDGKITVLEFNPKILKVEK